jgi:hypothetical protein
MKVIEFKGVCRNHDLFETVQMRGAATPRQLDAGFLRIQQIMARAGCDDYNITYGINSLPRDAELPHLYDPHYDQPAPATPRTVYDEAQE